MFISALIFEILNPRQVFVMSSLAFLTFALLVGSSRAFKTFKAEIPNGNKVPHPCKANFMWPGVGHQNRFGGGVNNQFGLDFKKAGYWWSKDICQADSDGDGLTNGQELGDPECAWSVGKIPSRTSNISHPGICDPYNSPLCSLKNSFVECDMEEFVCPRLNDTDVNHVNLTFLETTIPPTETNYYCMTFDLPNDQDYHMIATEPIMDNMEVLHHILIYECEDDNSTLIPTPQACGMEAKGSCRNIIGLWTVGNPGICFGDNIGFRFGKNAFKRVKLEIHYNNPLEKFGLKDKSGIRIHYQPVKSDVQDLVTVILGTTLFEIPAGEPRVEVDSICKGSCTRLLVRKPAKIFGAINHMHYLGSEMSMQLFRGGKKVADVAVDRSYNYDSPVVHTHSPALDLFPGDEIRTKCVYSSLNSPRSVFYGEATKDEMCYGFVFAYPKDAFTSHYCLTFDELDVCDLYTGKPLQTTKGECNWGAFTHFDENYSPPWTVQVKDNCRMDGYCRPQCREIVERLVKDDPCMTKDASTVINWRLESTEEGREALARINGCLGAMMSADPDPGHEDDGKCGVDECWEYCQDGHTGSGHGEYDSAPKMAAGWGKVTLLGLLLLKFYL
ncbi:hypothetical protein RRG08_038373 [Elysia crispata]|uniref:Temptin n=1 Tax=Elysia crispata TaxID=231223 RepID=A0AAE1DV18_9GAST|nr:hypothetical protein RRG08_038373 [Elysia crispata]